MIDLLRNKRQGGCRPQRGAKQHNRAKVLFYRAATGLANLSEGAAQNPFPYDESCFWLKESLYCCRQIGLPHSSGQQAVNELSQRGQRVAMKLVGCQLLVAILLAIGAFLLWNWDTAWSVATGAGVCVFANFVYAKLVFAQAGAKAAKKVLRAFYLGEVLKIVITACLFSLIIFYTKTVMLALLLGYILTQLVFWFALLFVT